jgi:hypothetical protein
MVASTAGKREYGGKERCVKYRASLGGWISECYGSFSLGGRFEIYESLIALSFQYFFLCCGKPRVTETADTESLDTVARLYISRLLFYFCNVGWPVLQLRTL